MNATNPPPVHLEGIHCNFRFERPVPGVVVVRLAGWDAGEFGDLPMQELAKDLAGDHSIELLLDARDVKGASIEVSGEWSQWLGRHRARFKHISMLTGSRFIEITASFVQRFAGLEDVMRIYTAPAEFDAAVSQASGGRIS